MRSVGLADPCTRRTGSLACAGYMVLEAGTADALTNDNTHATTTIIELKKFISLGELERTKNPTIRVVLIMNSYTPF